MAYQSTEHESVSDCLAAALAAIADARRRAQGQPRLQDELRRLHNRLVVIRGAALNIETVTARAAGRRGSERDMPERTNGVAVR